MLRMAVVGGEAGETLLLREGMDERAGVKKVVRGKRFFDEGENMSVRLVPGQPWNLFHFGLISLT